MSNENEQIRRALGPELHAMLELWGRVMRPTQKTATSPTHDICQRLATLAGVVEVAAAAGLSESDRKSAELTEQAWSFMRAPLEWKQALAFMYVGGLPLHIIARKVRAPNSACSAGIVSAAFLLNRTRMSIQQYGVPEDNRAYNSLTG